MGMTSAAAYTIKSNWPMTLPCGTPQSTEDLRIDLQRNSQPVLYNWRTSGSSQVPDLENQTLLADGHVHVECHDPQCRRLLRGRGTQAIFASYCPCLRVIKNSPLYTDDICNNTFVKKSCWYFMLLISCLDFLRLDLFYELNWPCSWHPERRFHLDTAIITLR